MLVLWVFRCWLNWFDKSWNDTKNSISKSSFLVFPLICLWSAWAIFLLSGNFFASSMLATIIATLYLLWKYSSKRSSEIPRIFQKIALRSLCLRNIDIHQKRSSPWIVLCLLVNASLFACVMHELEWFVSSVCICKNIRFVVLYKIMCLYSIFLTSKFK